MSEVERLVLEPDSGTDGSAGQEPAPGDDEAAGDNAAASEAPEDDPEDADEIEPDSAQGSEQAVSEEPLE